jgi:hypothetical protein
VARLNRLTLFAKGNLDVRDTLHALRIGGVIAWNGIGDIVRARHPDWTVRVRHETMTRPDAVLAATGEIPPELAARELDLGAYPAASQFSTALYDADCDAVVLSIQPSAKVALWRRKGDGWLFLPEGWETWAAADQAWLREAFDHIGVAEPEPSMASQR